MTNMTKSGLPRSVRKFIRLEKARIRAQFFDFKKQEELIKELYERILPKQKTQEVKESEIKTEKVKVQSNNKDKNKKLKVKGKPNPKIKK